MVSVTNPKSTSHPTAETDVFKSRLDSDTNERFIINADGKIEWGDGISLTAFLQREGNGLKYSANNNTNTLIVDSYSGGIDLNNLTGEGRIRLYGSRSTEAIVLRRSTLVGNEHPASSVPLIVKGAASQTADLQQWQDSAGNNIAQILSYGQFNSNLNGDGAGFVVKLNGLNKVALDSRGLRYVDNGLEQTTIGAAGTAAALPAAPTKYLRVVDSTGAILAIPAYASA